MEIEFLYFEECPNYKKAYEVLESVLREENIDAEIKKIIVKTNKDAIYHRFLGSPSIRINGNDVEKSASQRDDYGMKCRLYNVSGRFTGIPSYEMIKNAIKSNIIKKEI
ncbi:MAG: DF family (seleno)protein [Promethearchaeota archaeon]